MVICEWCLEESMRIHWGKGVLQSCVRMREEDMRAGLARWRLKIWALNARPIRFCLQERRHRKLFTKEACFERVLSEKPPPIRSGVFLGTHGFVIWKHGGGCKCRM